jgi:nucleoside-diphosphate-sugar epimerase
VFALLRPLPTLGPPLARLTLSLQVDDALTRTRLGWRPAISAEEGLTATARAFAGR